MKMDRIKEIFRRYNIALCYLFGSQKEIGEALLKGEKVEVLDSESDIDFAVLFKTLPENPLKVYASLSLDLQDMASPFRADLLFLHEVDHLIQLEAIKGICIYSEDEQLRDEYEDMVMMLAPDELEIFRRNERDFLEAIDDGYFEFEYQADRG